MKKDMKDAAESVSPSLHGVAQGQLREKEDALVGRELTPREALALLKTLDAPVGPVESMIEESVAGRYS